MFTYIYNQSSIQIFKKQGYVEIPQFEKNPYSSKLISRILALHMVVLVKEV
jgi:hypothetical protein